MNGIDATAKPKDAVTEPRALCGAQPDEYVRPCWYRAFVETAAGTRTTRRRPSRTSAAAWKACSAKRA